jgi:hypothetical protein
MKTIEIKKNKIKLELSRYELAILNNALNEVCNGIEVKNFESQMGMKTDEAEIFFDKLNLAYKELAKLSTDYQT